MKPRQPRAKKSPESEIIKSMQAHIDTLRKEIRHARNLYGTLLFSYNSEISGHLITLARAQADLAEQYAAGFRYGQSFAIAEPPAYEYRGINAPTPPPVPLFDYIEKLAA